MLKPKIHLDIRRGESPEIPLRFEGPSLVYAAITNMENTAPLRVTAPSHGLLDGWLVGFMNVGGMTNFNIPIEDVISGNMRKYLLPITYVDVDTFTVNLINASGLVPYLSGTGQIVYYQPLDLSVFTEAHSDLKTVVDGPPALSLSTVDGTYEIDVLTSTLWLRPAFVTPISIEAKKYKFDIELVKTGGLIVAPVSSSSTVQILPEITTT